ncbi:MAG: hypothetical protein KJ626_04800 [Verrucomicrobia bacterium]|nr:hypothetical protein [Verrucomicrobiota bacterium]
MSDLFHKLPYSLKVLATGFAAKAKCRQKYGTFFRQHLEFLTSSTVAEQEAKAAEELAEFLKRTAGACRFYAGIPADGDLRKMPVLTKALVVERYEDVVTGSPLVTVKSSGTSGVQLAVPYAESSYQREYAFWWYHRSFAGVKRGGRVATFGGHKVADVRRKQPPFWVLNKAENQVLFSSYHLSPDNLGHYIAQLNSFKPEFIHGYPSSIYLVARFALENDVEFSFCPKMIVTASETTLDFHRAVIEKAFRCKVYIWYGNTEYCGHITEGPDGRLRVQPYHSYVRVLDEKDADVPPGGVGRIVATSFSNPVFPLINYDTRDIVRVSEDQSSAGQHGGLVIDYIEGRVEDYIVTPEGRWVGRLDHLFKDAKHVLNAQLVQDQREALRIRMKVDSSYDTSIENIIRKEARQRLGDAIEIQFEYVKEIEKEANGKYKFVVQKLTLK